eukprot:GHVL01020005.1.p1 GENE.GHVL01020005.1~~GHVL01020005.1.p1  ORF type:complete len:271 (-),score=39.99 GHVL01020005.1:615-1427(-)
MSNFIRASLLSNGRHFFGSRSALSNFQKSSQRFYRHWGRTRAEDFELPYQSMPENIEDVMKINNPNKLTFLQNYWYWRIRSEATLLNPEELPKKDYVELARDLGLNIRTRHNEHMVGLLELYEYLKSAPFIGPFGTVENPVLVPSGHSERVVGCTGGVGDDEHLQLWFRCREGFLYRCGECDQVFMLIRLVYDMDEEEAKATGMIEYNWDENDVFDMKLLEKGHKLWNSDEMYLWHTGNQAYSMMFGHTITETQLPNQKLIKNEEAKRID